MKRLKILVATFCIFNLSFAQQMDSVSLSPMQSFFEVRLNPNDTAFRNTNFLLPPTGFIPDNKVPFKTKAEVDSITNLINELQQKIIFRNKQLQLDFKNNSSRNENTK